MVSKWSMVTHTRTEVAENIEISLRISKIKWGYKFRRLLFSFSGFLIASGNAKLILKSRDHIFQWSKISPEFPLFEIHLPYHMICECLSGFEILVLRQRIVDLRYLVMKRCCEYEIIKKVGESLIFHFGSSCFHFSKF